jgi:hypothetical protein
MTRARRGGVILGAGLTLMVIAHLGSAVAMPPMFDGVVVEEPYRYLSAPVGSPGHPSSASTALSLKGGESPNVYLGTTEFPPQAQLIVEAGAFPIRAGTTALRASIKPIAVTQPPDSGDISGNAYRIRVTDQRGMPVTPKRGSLATVVLRAPNGITNGVVYELASGAWHALPTQNGGLPDMYAVNVSELGTFAVVVGGPKPSSGGSALASPAARGSQLGTGLASPALIVASAVLLLIGLAIIAVRIRRPS